MKFDTARAYALSLPGAAEAPNHHFTSFRVRGRIFATAPPERDFLHLFLTETGREQALVMYPEFVEKLWWGGRVAGIRLALGAAKAAVVKDLLRQAWKSKAPGAGPRD